MKTAMKPKFFGWILAAMTAFAAMSTTASADTALSMTPNTANDFSNNPWSLGFLFTVNSAINVTQLGFYDAGDNGLTEQHQVGIYSLGGTLLTSTTVSNSDPLDSHFRYNSIAPLSLAAGQQYVIAATTGSELYTYDPTALATPSEITYVGSRFLQSSTLVFPDGFNDEKGYFGPNFKFENGGGAVPEPSALISAATASLIGLGVVRRRRRSA